MGEKKPFIWPNPTAETKKIILNLGKYKGVYDITSIGKQKIIKGPPNVFYHVRIIAKNAGREIVVVESESKEFSTMPTARQKQQTAKGELPKSLMQHQLKEAAEEKKELNISKTRMSTKIEDKEKETSKEEDKKSKIKPNEESKNKENKEYDSDEESDEEEGPHEEEKEIGRAHV